MGISREGSEAEKRFRELTGATRSRRAAEGDAIFTLKGKEYAIEVKKATSQTVNQVRPIKYIPLVVWDGGQHWYVVPADVQVRAAARLRRGQHTEIPFESMTMNVRRLARFRCRGDELRDRVVMAIQRADAHTSLKTTMERLLADVRDLGQRTKNEVGAGSRKEKE